MARFIAVEGENVWGLVREAVIRLDEREERHEPEEQLPFKRAHNMNSLDGSSLTFPQQSALII